MHRYSFFFFISRNVGSRWYRLRYDSRIYVGITSYNTRGVLCFSHFQFRFERKKETIRYEQRGVEICINKLSDGSKLPCSRISQARFYRETRYCASRFWTNSGLRLSLFLSLFIRKMGEVWIALSVKGKRVFASPSVKTRYGERRRAIKAETRCAENSAWAQLRPRFSPLSSALSQFPSRSFFPSGIHSPLICSPRQWPIMKRTRVKHKKVLRLAQTQPLLSS